MFSLIIPVLATALMALCALAALWYADGSRKAGESRVLAATLVGQAAQLSQAARGYARDKDIEPGTAALDSLADLTGSGYLLSAPNLPLELTAGGWNVDFANMRAWVDLRVEADHVCVEAQRSATGVATVPSAAVDVNGVFASSPQAYGCARMGAAGTAGTFFARL